MSSDRSSSPVLDDERVRGLLELAGAEEILEIFQLFFADMRKRLIEIETALAVGDTATVRRLGHAMKGAAANVGASRLADFADTLEAGEGVDAPEIMLSTLRGEVKALEDAVSSLR